MTNNNQEIAPKVEQQKTTLPPNDQQHLSLLLEAQQRIDLTQLLIIQGIKSKLQRLMINVMTRLRRNHDLEQQLISYIFIRTRQGYHCTLIDKKNSNISFDILMMFAKQQAYREEVLDSILGNYTNNGIQSKTLSLALTHKKNRDIESPLILKYVFSILERGGKVRALEIKRFEAFITRLFKDKFYLLMLFLAMHPQMVSRLIQYGCINILNKLLYSKVDYKDPQFISRKKEAPQASQILLRNQTQKFRLSVIKLYFNIINKVNIEDQDKISKMIRNLKLILENLVPIGIHESSSALELIQEIFKQYHFQTLLKKTQKNYVMLAILAQTVLVYMDQLSKRMFQFKNSEILLPQNFFNFFFQNISGHMEKMIAEFIKRHQQTLDNNKYVVPNQNLVSEQDKKQSLLLSVLAGLSYENLINNTFTKKFTIPYQLIKILLLKILSEQIILAEAEANKFKLIILAGLQNKSMFSRLLFDHKILVAYAQQLLKKQRQLQKLWINDLREIAIQLTIHAKRFKVFDQLQSCYRDNKIGYLFNFRPLENEQMVYMFHTQQAQESDKDKIKTMLVEQSKKEQEEQQKNVKEQQIKNEQQIPNEQQHQKEQQMNVNEKQIESQNQQKQQDQQRNEQNVSEGAANTNTLDVLNLHISGVNSQRSSWKESEHAGSSGNQRYVTNLDPQAIQNQTNKLMAINDESDKQLNEQQKVAGEDQKEFPQHVKFKFNENQQNPGLNDSFNKLNIDFGDQSSQNISSGNSKAASNNQASSQRQPMNLQGPRSDYKLQDYIDRTINRNYLSELYPNYNQLLELKQADYQHCHVRHQIMKKQTTTQTMKITQIKKVPDQEKQCQDQCYLDQDEYQNIQQEQERASAQNYFTQLLQPYKQQGNLQQKDFEYQQEDNLELRQSNKTAVYLDRHYPVRPQTNKKTKKVKEKKVQQQVEQEQKGEKEEKEKKGGKELTKKEKKDE